MHDKEKNKEPERRDRPGKINEDEAIQRGRKMIEIRKKTSDKSQRETEEEERKDADQWRNEG